MESDKSENMKIIKNVHKVSIAPMLDITDIHFRTLMRFITKETVLYTEMIHHDTILHSRHGVEKELFFDQSQKPTVIQLGGNKPDILERISVLCKNYNYDEINLNCGCPSSKVQNFNFGACLMRDPLLVSECTRRMKEASNLDVTVKCRLGLDNFDTNFLNDFISTVSQKGLVEHFVIHARLALMNLKTDQNRKIPPLQYQQVKELQEKFPNLVFNINGGIKSLDEVETLLQDHSGCMIGRAAYDSPWIFSDVDRRFYNKTNLGFSRKEIVYKYSEYCENTFKDYDNFNVFVKPLTNLFSGERKCADYKKMLYSYNNKEMSLADHLKSVIETYEKLNKRAVNKLSSDK